MDFEASIIQNLFDCGCDEDTVECCCELREQGRSRELQALLAKHRDSLLDAVHEEQKRIDRLDYLVYQLEKQERDKK